jgi:hypothetical protein
LGHNGGSRLGGKEEKGVPFPVRTSAQRRGRHYTDRVRSGQSGSASRAPSRHPAFSRKQLDTSKNLRIPLLLVGVALARRRHQGGEVSAQWSSRPSAGWRSGCSPSGRSALRTEKPGAVGIGFGNVIGCAGISHGFPLRHRFRLREEAEPGLLPGFPIRSGKNPH